LGVFNVVGVLVLSSMLADPYAKVALFRQGFGFILGLLPGLQAYAAAFFAIPLIRAFIAGKRNLEIDSRNNGRLEAVDLLQMQDKEVVEKSAAARKLGKRTVIGQEDVVYTTEKGTGEQVNVMEEDDFDQRLGVRRSSGQRSSRWEQRQLGDRSSVGNRVDDVFGRGQLRQKEKEVEVEWQTPRPRKKSMRGSDWDRRRDSDDWDKLNRW
jgi:hypothetical protein